MTVHIFLEKKGQKFTEWNDLASVTNLTQDGCQDAHGCVKSTFPFETTQGISFILRKNNKQGPALDIDSQRVTVMSKKWHIFVDADGMLD